MVAGLVDPCTNLTEVHNMRGARRTHRIGYARQVGRPGVLSAGDAMMREREAGPSTMGRTELGGPLQLSPAGRRHGGARGKRHTRPGKDNETNDRRRLPCPFLPSTVARDPISTCIGRGNEEEEKPHTSYAEAANACMLLSLM